MHIGNFASKVAASVILLVALFFPLQASAEDSWTVYTDTYRPYVMPENAPDGHGMRTVRLILEDMDIDYEFKYINFGYASYATRTDDKTITFPWRKSEEREENFHFSRPLFKVISKIYYNRQAYPDALSATQLDDMTFGEVEDYAYAESVDDLLADAEARDAVIMYASETEAIKALLLNEIDLLPLPSSVVEATLQAEFPNHTRLLQTVQNASDSYALHLLAPKTRAGRVFIDDFNAAYDRLRAEGIVQAWDAPETNIETNLGETARLITAEGFPVIVGRRTTGNKHEYFAIPQGTHVLVLEWSDKIQRPSNSDRIYKAMVDETKVLVLNGPHVAEELFVKNMHLAITE